MGEAEGAPINARNDGRASLRPSYGVVENPSFPRGREPRFHPLDHPEPKTRFNEVIPVRMRIFGNGAGQTILIIRYLPIFHGLIKYNDALLS